VEIGRAHFLIVGKVIRVGDPYPILFNPMKVPLGLQAHISEKEVRGSVKGVGSSGKVGEDAVTRPLFELAILPW
jgi:hypothetical protein